MFHPLFGREFELLDYRHTWGEQRVWYRDEDGETATIPATWTSAAPADPFVVASSGRAIARFEDLLTLANMISGKG